MRTRTGAQREPVMIAGRMFLHESRVPLRDADLRTEAVKAADAGQGQLFDDVALALDCEAGVCFR